MPRKGKAPKRNLAATITAATSGRDAPEPDPAALDEDARQTRAVIESGAKIPTPSRTVIRSALAYAEAFGNYLEKRGGSDLLSKSLTKTDMPKLLEDFLGHQIAESARRKGFSGDLIAQYAQGSDTVRDSPAKRYITAATVIGYRKNMCRVIAMFMQDANMKEKEEATDHIKKLASPDQVTACLGPGVARLLIEHVLSGDDREITPAGAQFAVIVLFHLYMGPRRSTLFATSEYPTHFARWRDIRFFVERDGLGRPTGVQAVITLKRFKGFIEGSARYKHFTFTIRDMNKICNIVLSLPIHLIAHAARLRLLDTDDLQRTLLSSATNEIFVREEAKDQPVFLRLKQGGRNIDPTGPLRGDAVGRMLKQHLRETGVSSPDDDTAPAFRLYGFRKDFATRGAHDPNVGPDVTRQMLGHGANSKTLEECYDRTVDHVSLTAMVGIEQSTAHPATDSADIRRGERRRLLPSRDLVALDPETESVFTATAILRDNVSRGSHEWKRLYPFREYPGLDDYDFEGATDLLNDYIAHSRNLLRKLRVREARGEFDKKAPVSGADLARLRKERYEELQVESKITRQLELSAVRAANQGGDEAPEEPTTIDMAPEELLEETGESFEGDDGDELLGDSEDPNETVFQRKVAFILKLAGIVDPRSPRACDACLKDPSVSAELQAKLYTPAKLQRHIGDGDPTQKRLFHSSFSRLKRILLLKGMTNPTAKEKPCGIGSCQGRVTTSSFLKHVDDRHAELIPADLIDYVKGELGRRAQSKKAANLLQASKARLSETATADSLRSTIPTLPFLPAPVTVTSTLTPSDDLIRQMSTVSCPQGAAERVPEVAIDKETLYNAVRDRIIALEESVPRGKVLDNSASTIMFQERLLPSWAEDIINGLEPGLEDLMASVELNHETFQALAIERIGGATVD